MNLSLSVKLAIRRRYIFRFWVVFRPFTKTYGVLIFKSAGNGGNFMKKLPGKLYHGSNLLSVVIGAINNDGYASNYEVGLGQKILKHDLASYGGGIVTWR